MQVTRSTCRVSGGAVPANALAEAQQCRVYLASNRFCKYKFPSMDLITPDPGRRDSPERLSRGEVMNGNPT